MSELTEIAVEKEDNESDFRAENMKFHHKDCGRLDFNSTWSNSRGKHWELKCGRCHNEAEISVGDDTIAVVKTAVDGIKRTLSEGLTVEQIPRRNSSGGRCG